MPRVLLVLLLLGTLPLRAAAAADERLAQAAAQADLQLVRQLLAARADVNAPDADGTTALHWAVWADHPETVRGAAPCGCDGHVAKRVWRHSDLYRRGTRQRGDHPSSARRWREGNTASIAAATRC